MENELIPDGFYSAEQMIAFGGYKTLASFRSALYSGRIPIEPATFGNKKYFRKDEVNAWLSARGNTKTPRVSKFQDVRRRLRSLKTECTTLADSPHLKGVG